MYKKLCKNTLPQRDLTSLSRVHLAVVCEGRDVDGQWGFATDPPLSHNIYFRNTMWNGWWCGISLLAFFQPYLGLLIYIEFKVLKRQDSLGRELAALEVSELNLKWRLYLKTRTYVCCLFEVSSLALVPYCHEPQFGVGAGFLSSTVLFYTQQNAWSVA